MVVFNQLNLADLSPTRELDAQWWAAHHPSELRLRDGGGYDSASTAPRSTEGSISEDVFTESELSPIREELQSTEELRQDDKSSGASCESVQTVAQAEAGTSGGQVGKGKEPPGPGSARGSASQEERPSGGEQSDTDSLTAQPRSSLGSEQTSEEQPPLQLSTPTSGKDQPDGGPGQGPASRSASQSSTTGAGDAPGGAKLTKDTTRDSESDVEELRKMWKSHTMQQAKEQRENVQQKESTAAAEGKASLSTLTSQSCVLMFFSCLHCVVIYLSETVNKTLSLKQNLTLSHHDLTFCILLYSCIL